MSALYPTPTRLRLLRQVDRRSMAIDEHGDSRDATGRCVTAVMNDMDAAGWIEMNETGWWTTDAGRAVLDAAEVTR